MAVREGCRRERSAAGWHGAAFAWGITRESPPGWYGRVEGTLRDRFLRSERVCRAADAHGTYATCGVDTGEPPLVRGPVAHKAPAMAERICHASLCDAHTIFSEP